MRVPYLSLLLAAAVGLVRGDDAPSIRVPTTPVVPTPMPAPGSPLDLTADFIYPVDSDVPFKIFASPGALVKITKEEGPLRVRGKFVGGTGGVETRTFKGKYLAFVEPAGKGTVEVIVDPTDAKTEDAAIRQTLRVDNNTAPQPPPPCPDPGPSPGPAPAPVSAVKWVVVVEETSQRTPAITAVLGDLNYWRTLTARGLSWRFYDKDSPDAKAKGYDAIGAKAGLPCLIFLDAQGKNPATGGEPVGIPLPKTTGGVDAALKAVTK